MAHTVSGLIRKAPHIQTGQNNNGNYTMFCFELAEFNKGTQGKEDSYTNYSVALFAKSQGAIDFHGKAIAEGSFVVVNCDKLMVEKQTSKQDGREFIKLKMMNASLGDFNNPNQQQAAPQQQGGYSQPTPQQQGGFNNQQQQAQPNQNGSFNQQPQPQQQGYDNTSPF